jgi:hypothetical protein
MPNTLILPADVATRAKSRPRREWLGTLLKMFMDVATTAFGALRPRLRTSSGARDWRDEKFALEEMDSSS